MLRLTPRLTPGCTIAALDMPLTHTAMVIMVIIWVTLPIMDTLTTMATTARGRLRLNLLPRLMLKLPQRLTPGYTITGWDMPLTPTATVIMVWAMLPTLAITHTLTTEAAGMATEPSCPVPPGNSVEVSALVLMK